MKFSGQSDRTVVISLPSAITEIFWHEKEGFVNGAVTFEVRTAYVYWGAPIKILLKNKEGKTIKNFDDGKVFELHRRIIALGPEAAGGVFCEVELPEHKVKAQSPLLKVPGAIRVKSVTWKDKESGKTLSEVTRDQETLLEAKVEGGSPEAKAFFTVFEKRGEHVHRLIDLPAKVEQGTMAVNWLFTHSAPTAATYSSQSAREPTAENYQPPAFFIEATVAGAKLKGEEIPLQDATVVEVVDENGIPQSEREVSVVLPDGSERKEVTDELGKVYLGNIPPGEIRFILGPPVAKEAAAEEGVEGKPEGKKQEGKAGQGVAPKPGSGMGDVKMAEREGSSEKIVKKGDKGFIVEELNIRLAGFGGGVPKDVFDSETEKKVRQFQSDWMKLATPSGVLDKATAEAIDSFSVRFSLAFEATKCVCGKCGGYGQGQYKGEYKGGERVEKNHKYEYPGMHRSLLWGFRGILFYMQNKALGLDRISSGYRCWINNKNHKRDSTNHMGKALDFTVSTSAGGVNKKGSKAECDMVRELVVAKLAGAIRWKKDKFCVEPSDPSYPNEYVATNWVHVDVREFSSKYLDDKYFCKSSTALNGKPMVEVLK